MSEEKNNSARRTRGWLAKFLLFLLFVGGWILFAFGVVGLYEDREFVSLDTILAAVGLVLVIFSIPALLGAVRASEEKDEFGIGGGVLLTIWAGFKLARGTANNKAWWIIGILVVVVIVGISWIVMGLQERREAAAAGRSSADDELPAPDSETSEPAEE